ncbi:MAG: transposase [Desulfobacterales bacterium]|nr:transposase [Desulfobacterales bacterium]
MANSYISLYVHYVFSTKERLPLIVPEIQNRLWAYIGGIARKNKMKKSVVPTGLNPFCTHLIPTMNCRAIVECPSRTEKGFP